MQSKDLKVAIDAFVPIQIVLKILVIFRSPFLTFSARYWETYEKAGPNFYNIEAKKEWSY